MRDPDRDKQSDDSVFACSEAGIRDAIEAGGGPHAFACDGPTIVTLEESIVIGGDVILDGLGALTIDGDQAHRVLTILPGARVELRQLNIVGGDACLGAAGIENAGMLVLDGCIVANNRGCQVGGIRNTETGMLVLRDSVLSGNDGEDVGGIINEGTLQVIRTQISRNRGNVGGIDNLDVTRIENSAIVANEGESAGGIRNRELALMLVRDAMLLENRATDVGGVMNREGKVVLTRTIVVRNSGESVGAVRNEGSRSVTLVDCDVSDNDGDVGGLHNSGFGTLSLSGTFIADGCHGPITSNGTNAMHREGMSCGFDEAKGDTSER